MHTVFALLCFVVVIHWLIFSYPSGLLHWHCSNLTIAPVPAKQLWWIWINTSCEFIMNDCRTTTKQSTTKPCAYFLGYTVRSCIGTTLHRYDFCWFGFCHCLKNNDWLWGKSRELHCVAIIHFFFQNTHNSYTIPSYEEWDMWYIFLWFKALSVFFLATIMGKMDVMIDNIIIRPSWIHNITSSISYTSVHSLTWTVVQNRYVSELSDV